MKMTLALLLALFALTAMADTPTEAATLQAPKQAAGIERAEPAPPSSYRGRFGSSAASRNARHLSSELEDPPTDEARGCPDPDHQHPKSTPSAPCANQFL
ncbi:MAG: hypothetical protein IT487_19005 [Chromatiaceae bacterium]|nr:hypothetical protein [Chromatiaceae bacterium]